MPETRMNCLQVLANEVCALLRRLTATMSAASIMTIDPPAAFQWVLQVEPDKTLLLAPLQQETWETQPL